MTNGQWTDVVYQVWELGAWENEVRFTDLVWQNWSAQQPASYREQAWQGTWADDSRYTFAYAPNGTVVAQQEEAVSPGAWALSSRATDTFDNFGNYLGSRHEARQGNAWVLESEYRELVTYTAANDVRFRVSQEFSRSSGPAFENLERYNFSGFQGITLGTAPAALAAQARLYPNPTAGTTTLALTGLGHAGSVQVDVLNGLGQALLRRTARPTAGQLHEVLDLRALPAGVYTVRIHAPEGTVTKRLVRE